MTEGQYLTAFLFLTKPFLPIGFWNSEACELRTMGARWRCVALTRVAQNDVPVPAVLGITFNQILCGGFMLAPGSMTVSFLLNTFSKASSKVCATSTGAHHGGGPCHVSTRVAGV